MLAGTPGTATAAIVFLPLWFVGAATNLYVAVKRAGCSVKEKPPFFFSFSLFPLLWRSSCGGSAAEYLVLTNKRRCDERVLAAFNLSVGPMTRQAHSSAECYRL